MPGPRRTAARLRTLGVALGAAAAIALCLSPSLPAAGDPHYCDGCTPPLLYQGGPVLNAGAPSPLTVTPIYWAPQGSRYRFPSHFEAIVDGYVTNIAAASGSDTDVFSVAEEYYQVVGDVKTPIAYALAAGTPVVDPDPFPADGCRPADEETACVTDQQLRDELSALSARLRLPTDAEHFYAVFFPAGVETQDRDKSTSLSSFCGYHRSYGSGTRFVDYADIPYEPQACTAGEAPNGTAAADGAVSTLSHELNESITDPDGNAWLDSAGDEMADLCAQFYGRPLGSTNPADPTHTEYNQLINGGKYYTQTEFSNFAYAALGQGRGCVQSEADAHHPSGGTQSTVTYLFVDATPTRLPANGSARSTIRVEVGDQAGDVVTADPVTFQTHARTGTGPCGHLSKTHLTTGTDGTAAVTYTASKANVVCDVTAIEGDGGRSADSVIYQGTTRAQAPRLIAHFPAAVRAGNEGQTFTITVENPSGSPVPDARVDFSFYRGTKAPGVRASQIHLAASAHGASGPFVPIALTGDTTGNDSVTGSAGPPEGSPLAPHSTVTDTFRLSVAASVPRARDGRPLLALEAYLDQIDSASGSGATLDDSYASNLAVTRSSSLLLAHQGDDQHRLERLEQAEVIEFLGAESLHVVVPFDLQPVRFDREREGEDLQPGLGLGLAQPVVPLGRGDGGEDAVEGRLALQGDEGVVVLLVGVHAAHDPQVPGGGGVGHGTPHRLDGAAHKAAQAARQLDDDRAVGPRLDADASHLRRPPHGGLQAEEAELDAVVTRLIAPPGPDHRLALFVCGEHQTLGPLLRIAEDLHEGVGDHGHRRHRVVPEEHVVRPLDLFVLGRVLGRRDYEFGCHRTFFCTSGGRPRATAQTLALRLSRSPWITAGNAGSCQDARRAPGGP